MKHTKTNFGKSKVSLNKKTPLVQKIFTDVTKNYDLMNDLMSLGTHRIWKKSFVELINVQKKDEIIEVGSGTGDILKYLKNLDISLTAIDLNSKMLNEAKKKYNIYKNIKWINCNAEVMPFKDNSFDKYIITFCLRNVTYIDKVLNEAQRILKPGGIFYCLEFSKPQSSFVNKFYSLYKEKIIPIMGEKIGKNRKAYEYLGESIEMFPNQDTLLFKLKK